MQNFSVNKLAVVGLVLFAGLDLSAQQSARPLSISLEPAAAGSVRVTTVFNGDADGETAVKLPDEWGGQEKLYAAILDLQIAGGEPAAAGPELPAVRVVRHKPNAKLSISYTARTDFDGPLRNEVRYRPVTGPEYMHWVGGSFWVLPDWKDDERVALSIRFRRFPVGWRFANSFGEGTDTDADIDFGSLGSSIFVGGDFRISETKVAGKTVKVAIRSNWEFSDSELTEMVGKVIGVQRDFWQDHSQDKYLVTLVPFDEGPNAYSFGGTGLRDSFALFATRNATISGLRALLAHEYFHNWNPVAIGTMPEPEAGMYWLSEGFTEFYTYELLERGGLMTRPEKIAAINDLIREYYMLPVREDPNARIVRDFWKDRNVGRLPYLRGLIFAANLNGAVRRATGGRRTLDGVMKDLRRHAAIEKSELSPQLLAASVLRVAGIEIDADIERYLVRGELIAPVGDGFGTDIRVETKSFPVFELGFDGDSLFSTRNFSGVVAGSAAYEAGLRDGQKLVGPLSIHFGNTVKPIKFRVKDSEGEREVSFTPVAREQVAIPQLVITR